MAQPLHSWYVERPEGCTAQPTLHQHAEKNNLAFTGTEGSQMVWVKNRSDNKEFVMCCYYKTGFCEFSILKPDKRGNIRREFHRHVHGFSTCGVCGFCWPLPIRKQNSSRIEPSKCFQCLEHYTKVIETQASELKLQEETLMLDFQRRGEALQNQADELRLQQNLLTKATQDHKKAVKKAQEQQGKCVKDIAASCQRRRTKGMSLQYTNIK
jgi:hypothetical protein